jgi:phosphatidylglycerophosphatase A
LAGIPVYLALAGLPLWGYCLAVAGLIGASIFIAARAEAIYGGHDDRRIVIDEVVGYLVTMTGAAPTVIGISLGFVIFRVFDIVKPWPCSAIDRRMPGGSGVVLDDVAAGVYGAITLNIIHYFWPALKQVFRVIKCRAKSLPSATN